MVIQFNFWILKVSIRMNRWKSCRIYEFTNFGPELFIRLKGIIISFFLWLLTRLNGIFWHVQCCVEKVVTLTFCFNLRERKNTPPRPTHFPAILAPGLWCSLLLFYVIGIVLESLILILMHFLFVYFYT